MLLYVSDAGSGDVYVFRYPKGKLAGKLTGFNFPEGECADKAGNVWIVNTGTSEIFEYAHGGTSPIATIEEPGQSPGSCSINKKNGNLAITNVQTASGGSGSIAIYKKAKGSPTMYSDPNLFAMYFLDYDDMGNIFVDGTNASGAFRYAELPKNSKTFQDITLNQSFVFPGGVQYVNGQVAIADSVSDVIYQTSGATIIGSTKLQAGRIEQFYVQRQNVINPDPGLYEIEVFKYPAGGPATKVLARYLSVPVGAAISK